MVKNRDKYFRARARVNSGWMHWLFQSEADYSRRTVILNAGRSLPLNPAKCASLRTRVVYPWFIT